MGSTEACVGSVLHEHPRFAHVLVGFMTLQGPFMVVHGEDCTVYIFLCESSGIWSWGDGFVGEGTCCANVRPEFKSPAPHKKPSMTLCLPLPQHCGGVETSLTGACSLPASLQAQRPTLSEENKAESAKYPPLASTGPVSLCTGTHRDTH